MSDEKARVGFSLDFKDSKTQIDALVKSLDKLKTGFKDTGKEGESSLNRVNLGLKSVFNNISTMSKNLRKGISDGQKMSRKQLKETLEQAKSLEGRLVGIHAKTAQKFEQAEGKKRAALKSTLKAQEKALKAVKKVGEESVQAIKKQEVAFSVLASLITVKLSSAFRDLIKESTLLAARNEVLATAMRTVGNNAGISNTELERSEMTIRKLGVSINDTRELISRFSQAQLGMEQATKLARAAQELAAGSTLGSSEALRIMTQSILSLLPRQLRQFGVVVNLNQVYQEQSKILGKSVNDLTSLEKRQGLLNKIFEEAAKRAGAYERSMEDAGKVLTTLSSRVIPDTLSMLGEEFQPVLDALVFGFQDLLKWVQRQSGGFKSFIATMLAVGTAITTLGTVLVSLSGTLGFVKAGFVGAATAARATLLSMGPLAAAIAAIGAALVTLPKLFRDTATAQEQMVESSKTALNIQLTRLKALEDLQNILKNQALTEEEVSKIIRRSIGRHKELIPLLNKEGLVRQDVVDIIGEHIDKQKELVAIRQGEAKKALEEDIERLKDEQFILGELIKRTERLAETKRKEGLSVLEVSKSNREFVAGLTDQQRALENLDDFLKSAYILDLEELNKTLGRTDSKIEVLSLDLTTKFGTATKEASQSASDMQQALLGLEKGYDKLANKALKKLPFAALAKEQEEALKRVDNALQNRLITQEKANELRFKNEALFQNRFRTAELKFREQLDTIGKSSLQKIEARRVRLVEVNQGSAVAIKAIEKKAAVERNVIFEKMWQDRLKVVQQGVEAIVGVIRTQRDLSVNELKQEANVLISQERLTTDGRIEVRQDFQDQALTLLRNSQDEELSVRQQHFQAVALNIQELFNKGLINEEQFNTRSKALATDLKNFRQQQLSQRVDFLKSALDEMYSEEVSINERLKQLEQGRLSAARSTADTIRKLQQQGLTAQEVFLDERERAERLLSEGEAALREDNFDRVKQINGEIKSIAQATSKEVRESGKKDAEVLISADKARIGSIKLVEEAGALLQRSFKAQRSAEVLALDKVKDKIDEIKNSLDILLAEKKQIEIEIIGNADEQIDVIQSKLDGLQNKTVTVTVVTRNVTVGGGGPAVTAGGADAIAGGPISGAGIPSLANGAVDINGPGSSTSDSIRAFLSKGESVVNAAATRMFKPILELMNTNPEALKSMLAPQLAGVGGTGGKSVSDTTNVGDVKITINGIDSKDVQNINWRRVVRNDIIPELKKVKTRRAVI